MTMKVTFDVVKDASIAGIFLELEQAVANPLVSFDTLKTVSSSPKRNAFATLSKEYIGDPERTRGLWRDLKMAFVSGQFAVSEIIDYVTDSFGIGHAEAFKRALNFFEESWREEELLLLATKAMIITSINVDEIIKNIPIITKCEWDTDEIHIFLIAYDEGLMLQEAGSACTFPQLNVVLAMIDTDTSWVKSRMAYLEHTITHELIHINVESCYNLGWTRDSKLSDIIFDKGVGDFLASKVLARIKEPSAAMDTFGELDAALMDSGFVCTRIGDIARLMVEWYEAYSSSSGLFDEGLKMLLAKADELDIEHCDIKEIQAKQSPSD